MSKFSTIEKRVLAHFATLEGAAASAEALAQTLNYGGSKMYKRLLKALNFLTHVGELEQTGRGDYRLKVKQVEVVVGTYRANAQGFGFVTYAEGESDYFVPRGRALNAMQGDTVEVQVLKHMDPMTGKGSEVQVLRVIERAVHQLVGEFTPYHGDLRQERQALGYVVPQGDYSPDTRVEINLEGIEPADHAIVLVHISQYPTPDAPHLLRGYVAKEIGHRDEPGVDILSVLYQFGIPHEFPEAVREAAEAVPQTIDPADLAGREDLRDAVILTIDGADAKDLDDAISLERLDNGDYRLGVHIADVSHYVTEGSPLDLEAYQRGTSVYLTDRVVPMLPQRLSNGICSLHPQVDRLTLSCEMVLDAQGNLKHHRIFPSVIHSSYRMTYDDVNAILAGDQALRDTYAPIVDLLEEMSQLHHLLETKRTKRGALDFEAPEAKVIVDDKGQPVDIELRERGVAERLIESFMLAANETVAQHYMQRAYPMLYRVHEQPDVERMQRFAEFVTAFGIVMRGNVASIAPKQLQGTLDQVRGEGYEQAVSTMMLRSMKQARYSEEPLGHYGLATAEYTHFTSPIRRYPDLIVHRLIHTYLKQKPSHQDKARLADQLPGIADQSSKMERRAIEAERDVMAMKKAEFMVDKIGQEFEAVVSSVTSFGLFVALPNTVEGLISLKDLNDDYYEFDQSHLVLMGQRTGRIFRIGQRVTVRLEAVNVGEREIDFALLEAEPVTGPELTWLRPGGKSGQSGKPAKGGKGGKTNPGGKGNKGGKNGKGSQDGRRRRDRDQAGRQADSATTGRGRQAKAERRTRQEAEHQADSTGRRRKQQAANPRAKGDTAATGRSGGSLVAQTQAKGKKKGHHKDDKPQNKRGQRKSDSRPDQQKAKAYGGNKSTKAPAKGKSDRPSDGNKFKQFKIKRKQPTANRFG